MTSRTETQSIETECEPDAIFDVLADPKHIPLWAPGFADAITGDEKQGWKAAKSGQVFALRIVPAHPARTVDFLREIAPGREGGAYVRVLPRPNGGSVVVMTLPVPPGADAKNISATLGEELAALARLAEDLPTRGRTS